MFDLFGNHAPQGVKAAPDALSREIEARKREVLRPKEVPHRNPDVRVMVDFSIRALTPKAKREERYKFRTAAKRDANYLRRKGARALPVGILYTEYFVFKSEEGA
jgi:hypothetical protein